MDCIRYAEKIICGLKACKQKNATFSSSYQCNQQGYSKLKRSNQYIQSRIMDHEIFIKYWRKSQLLKYFTGNLPETKVHRRGRHQVWCGAGGAGWSLAAFSSVQPHTHSQVRSNMKIKIVINDEFLSVKISGPSGAARPELRAQLLRGVQVQVLALWGLGRGEKNSYLSFCKISWL